MKGIFSLKYEFRQSYWCLIHGILRPNNTVFAFLGHEGQPPPEVVEGGWRAFHEGAIFSTVSPPRAGKELPWALHMEMWGCLQTFIGGTDWSLLLGSLQGYRKRLGFGSQNVHFFLSSSILLCFEWLREQAVPIATWDLLAAGRRESSLEKSLMGWHKVAGRRALVQWSCGAPWGPTVGWSDHRSVLGDRMGTPYSHDRGCRLL